MPQHPDPALSGENRADRDLAPEAHNLAQDDEAAQAQSLVDDPTLRATAVLGDPAASERTGDDDAEPGSGTPDLVDHMTQMVTSGRIDMGAYRGERSDDDEDGALGDSGIEDDGPRGAP